VTDRTDDFDTVRGTGNVFADLGLPGAKLEQLRSILAAEIGNTLGAKGWGVREAARQTGVPAADFSRIRNANLGRFTIDRLMIILDKLNRDVEVDVRVVAREVGGVGYRVLAAV
jgi:predicted XRE-type DNA-binding protein